MRRDSRRNVSSTRRCPASAAATTSSYGGAGILVFDIDHGHKFVKRMAMPTSLPLPPSTNGRPVSPQEAIKGIAAHAGTARLYVSTNRRVAAYDLLTDKLVWEQRYEERGTDRIALSPDGTTLYAPELGAPKWVVADAKTGALITTIDKPGNPHNTQYSDDGTRVYFEAEGNTRTMSVVDAKTRTIVKEIGPFGNMVRPFTFNGKQTLLFANINDFLGFEIADLKTGADPAPRRSAGRHRRQVADARHPEPRHRDDAGRIRDLDRRQRQQLPAHLRRDGDAADDEDERQGARRTGLDHVRHRRQARVSVDRRCRSTSKTKQIVATLQDENGANAESEKMLEIDFAGGKPSVAGDQFGKGKKALTQLAPDCPARRQISPSAAARSGSARAERPGGTP